MRESGLFTVLCTMLVIVLYVDTARAAVIVDKPPNGVLSTTPFAGGSNVNVDLDFERIADDFSVADSTSVINVSWYGFFGSSSPTANTTADFDILFYNDAAGIPNTTPLYMTTIADANGSDAGLNAEEFDILQWTASIPAASFSDPGTYWISVQAHADPLDVDTWWQWAGANPISGESASVVFQNEGSTVWSVCTETTCNPDLYTAHAFTLGVVPVPGAIWLFISGLVGLIGISRGKKA